MPICKNCLKEFKSRRPNNTQKFCSLLCIFMNNIYIDENGCWIWKGKISKRPHNNSYNQSIPFSFSRDNVTHTLSARRYAFKIAGIKIDEDSIAIGTCENELCVNPFHNSIGNRKDNASLLFKINYEDMYPGMRNFDKETVKKIAEDTRRASELANEYNVCEGTILKIRKEFSPENIVFKGKAKDNLEEILRLKREGKKQIEIARILDINDCTISRLLNKSGNYS